MENTAEVVEISQEMEDSETKRVSTPNPELIEEVLRIIASFVFLNSGIKGLMTFRQVSPMWSRAGTDVFNQQDITLSTENFGHNWWPKKFLKLDRFDYEGSRLSRPCFKTACFIELSGRGLAKLFGLHQPWTGTITKLGLFNCNAYDWNELLKEIVSEFPQLVDLTVESMVDIYDDPKANRDHAKALNAIWNEWEEILSDNPVMNTNLRRFSLITTSHFELECLKFNWNFIQLCPNVEKLVLFFNCEVDPEQLPVQNISRIVSELKRLSPKLKSFEIDWDADVTVPEVVPHLAEFINFFCPLSFKACLQLKSLEEFAQRTSLESCKKMRSFHLDVKNEYILSEEDRNLNLFFLLFSLITERRFSNLKILNLDLRDGEMPFCDTRVVDVPVLKNVTEFRLTRNCIREGQGRWGFYRIYSRFSTFLPGLQVFDGLVIDDEECRALLVELGKLTHLWKVVLRSQREFSYKKEIYFGDGNNYQGIAGLARVKEFVWDNYYDDTNYYQDLSEFFTSGRMPCLKRLGFSLSYYPWIHKVIVRPILKWIQDKEIAIPRGIIFQDSDSDSHQGRCLRMV